MTSIAEKYAAQWLPNGEVSLADLIQAAINESESLLIVGARERIRDLEWVNDQHKDNALALHERIRQLEAQSVPVVGDVVAWLQYRDHSGMRPTTIHLCDSDSKGAFEVIRKPAHSITSAELVTLREKAAMADELRKKLAAYDRLNKELDAAIAQGKGE